MLDFSACRGWSVGCHGGGSQRKPTRAEIKHKYLISALVGDDQWDDRWDVMAVAARESLQALKLSMNA